MKESDQINIEDLLDTNTNTDEIDLEAEIKKSGRVVAEGNLFDGKSIIVNDEMIQLDSDDFLENYEFVEKCGINDIYKKRNSQDDSVYKAIYDNYKVILIKVTNEKVLNKFEKLRGNYKLIFGDSFDPKDIE